MLAASYDPGWTATIDGHPAATEMIAPALVGVTVPPGTHHITFRYTGLHRLPRTPRPRRRSPPGHSRAHLQTPPPAQALA